MKVFKQFCWKLWGSLFPMYLTVTIALMIFVLLIVTLLDRPWCRYCDIPTPMFQKNSLCLIQTYDRGRTKFLFASQWECVFEHNNPDQRLDQIKSWDEEAQ